MKTTINQLMDILKDFYDRAIKYECDGYALDCIKEEFTTFYITHVIRHKDLDERYTLCQYAENIFEIISSLEYK